MVVNVTRESFERVIAQGCWSEQVLFGKAWANKAGFTEQGEPDSFDVLKAGQPVAKVEWAVSGVHNQLNALAAIAAAEHVGGLDWDAREALAPMVDRAHVADNVEELVKQVKAAARGGDHVRCMSNGGFVGCIASCWRLWLELLVFSYY